MFGTQYVDEIVRWWRDGRGAMYVFQDANWNVTSTVSYMTQPLDRVRTTPYGQPTFDVEVVNGDWDDDGDTDSADGSALLDCFSVGDEGDCRIYDYDDNGTINLNDYFDLLALMPAGASLQRQPSRRTSPNHFPFAHQGLVLDEETGAYQNRRRQRAVHLVGFLQRDPLEQYVDSLGSLRVAYYKEGLNLYAAERSNPVSFLDPIGLQVLVCNRPSDNFPGANHAYFWDTRTSTSCGQDGSSGSGSGGNNPGGGEDGPFSVGGLVVNPDGDCCVPIPNSEGVENAIMACCKEVANDGVWIPFLNDCHVKISDCGSAGGAGPPPPPPGGHFGDSEACKGGL